MLYDQSPRKQSPLPLAAAPFALAMRSDFGGGRKGFLRSRGAYYTRYHGRGPGRTEEGSSFREMLPEALGIALIWYMLSGISDASLLARSRLFFLPSLQGPHAQKKFPAKFLRAPCSEEEKLLMSRLRKVRALLCKNGGKKGERVRKGGFLAFIKLYGLSSSCAVPGKKTSSARHVFLILILRSTIGCTEGIGRKQNSPIAKEN